MVQSLTEALKPLQDEGKIKSPKTTKSKIPNVSGFGYLNVQDDKAAKAVQDVLAAHGFVEE